MKMIGAAIFCFCIMSCRWFGTSLPPSQGILAEGNIIPVSARSVILNRGNEWVIGVPGFGQNVFPALYGDYLLEAPPQDKPDLFSGKPFLRVWVSRMSFPIANASWTSRQNMTPYTVFQRPEGDQLLLLYSASGGTEITVFFQIPGTGEEFLGAAGLDRLLVTWISRFLYFVSRTEVSAGLSLPAVVNF